MVLLISFSVLELGPANLTLLRVRHIGKIFWEIKEISQTAD